jgi:hypothetical protein
VGTCICPDKNRSLYPAPRFFIQPEFGPVALAAYELEYTGDVVIEHEPIVDHALKFPELNESWNIIPWLGLELGIGVGVIVGDGVGWVL